MGNNCWGAKSRLIVFVYNDMSKASVKVCGMKSVDGCGLWSMLEDTSV